MDTGHCMPKLQTKVVPVNERKRKRMSDHCSRCHAVDISHVHTAGVHISVRFMNQKL